MRAADTLNTAIWAENLVKYYGELCAVDHITFEVKKGEIFGFLGPNGSGKTTTIRMLVGLTTPSAGSALVNGYDIKKEMVEIKRSVGVVPEVSNLYDELTLWDNLLFIARLYHVPKHERHDRIHRTLKTFGLWDRRDVKFGRLSKGLKRRLTVAAALVHQPDIVFLDEPTTGLDVMSARTLRLLLGQLKEAGVTIFLTTHYIEEADQLCDRIAILVGGRIVTIDTPENLKSIVQDLPVVEASFHSNIESTFLRDLEAVGDIVVDGDTVRLLTRDVSTAINALTVFAIKNGLPIKNVSTARPSLEDAFVKLTGVEYEIMGLEKERRGQT